MQDSQGVLQYVLRSVADGQDVMHVLCVILQRDGAGQRLQARFPPTQRCPSIALLHTVDDLSFASLGQQLTQHLCWSAVQVTSTICATLQAQTDIRQQYGTQLKNHKHKLHIIRVIMRGSKEDKPAVAAYVARAICAKATLLHANGALCQPSQLLQLGASPSCLLL